MSPYARVVHVCEVTAASGKRLGEATYRELFMSTSDDKRELRPGTSVRARLRQKAQLTLPEEVRHVLHVGEGDEVEFTVEANGRVTVRGYVSVPTDQAWFFTPERLAGKRQVDSEIAMDRGTVHDSGEAMFVNLDSLGAMES
jgi:antitoxin PrlF